MVRSSFVERPGLAPGRWRGRVHACARIGELVTSLRPRRPTAESFVADCEQMSRLHDEEQPAGPSVAERQRDRVTALFGRLGFGWPSESWRTLPGRRCAAPLSG